MESTFGSYNQVEVDLAALVDNYKAIQGAISPGTKIMAIVKSDAYGHGLVPVAKALCGAGVRNFGVAEAEEGIALREAGISGEIVVLLGSPAAFFPEIVAKDLQVVVVDRQDLKALSAYCEKKDCQVGVHLKIDTGMGRLGIMPEEVHSYLELFEMLPGVRLAGVMSHFPRADDLADLDYTERQNLRFAEIVTETKKRYNATKFHAANSAAIMNFSVSHYDMVRPGISLYGCFPTSGMEGINNIRLKPVMSFKTRVIQVKEVPADYGISYGHIFKTNRPTRLAVLPVGYADGYLRRLAGRAEVLICGCRVPILGRICMNACMADITDLGEVKIGDEVVVMGRQGEAEITADEIAEWSDSISYEILCLFGSSNERKHTNQERT